MRVRWRGLRKQPMTSRQREAFERLQLRLGRRLDLIGECDGYALVTVDGVTVTIGSSGSCPCQPRKQRPADEEKWYQTWHSFQIAFDDPMVHTDRRQMDKITTTIKREWLKRIANRTKRVEYRQMKPCWAKKLSHVHTPFLLRLINGMQPKAPEITVTVKRIRKNSSSRQYELVIGKIVELKHWSVKLGRPT